VIGVYDSTQTVLSSIESHGLKRRVKNLFEWAIAFFPCGILPELLADSERAY